MKWLPISQYTGFSILEDASKIKTPEGEFDLTPGKLFYFTNPNTGTKNFAKPDILLARALKSTGEAQKVSKSSKETKGSKEAPTTKKKRKTHAEKEAERRAKQAAKEEKAKKKAEAKLQAKINKLKRSKEKEQLVPDEVVGKLQMYMKQQKRKEAGLVEKGEFCRGLLGISIDFHKHDSIFVITFDTSKDLVLMRLEGPQDWRANRWIYNPFTEKYVEFDMEKHHPVKGPVVIWPEDLGGEHLFGPDYVQFSQKQHPGKKRKKKGEAVEEPLPESDIEGD